MSWILRIARSAQNEMEDLPSQTFERVDRAILRLAEDPHCSGTRKLTGLRGYRLRVGRYRVLYDLDKQTRVITVLTVRHRREAYR